MTSRFNNRNRRVMKIFKTSTNLLFLTIIGSNLLAACAAPQAGNASLTSNPESVQTVKPGAAVTFSHTGPKDLQPGQYGKIKIRVTDNYESGTLDLAATPDEGMRLVTETAETSFSMSGDPTHEWELDVTAATRGVYYLNVFASAKLPNGTEMLRSYSAQVLVGDVTEADMKKSLKTNGSLSKDGKTISMQADETIQ